MLEDFKKNLKKLKKGKIDISIEDLPKEVKGQINDVIGQLLGDLYTVVEELIFEASGDAALPPYDVFANVTVRDKKLDCELLFNTEVFYNKDLFPEVKKICEKLIKSLPFVEREAAKLILKKVGGLPNLILTLFSQSKYTEFRFDDEDELQAYSIQENERTPITLDYILSQL